MAIEKALEGTFGEKTGRGRGRGKGMVVEFEDVRTGKEFFRCVLIKLKGQSHLYSSICKLGCQAENLGKARPSASSSWDPAADRCLFTLPYTYHPPLT